MPRCPICKTQAERIKYEGVPVYNCGSCGGHWVSPARLDVILARRDMQMPEPVKQKMMAIADEADSKQELWCMTCGTSMLKEQFRYWPEIKLDRCPKCNGIWLDRGELEKCQIYWEYAQDHPDEEHADLLARKALLDAEWARRKSEIRDRRDRIEAASRMRMGFGYGSVLGGLFG
ncbi:MAG: zf-TFIIB domain-containing protein [Planctomycetes bacterium]|nr:zf-TFIIB domain-containing protein [Planctomycetota bacterium]